RHRQCTLHLTEFSAKSATCVAARCRLFQDGTPLIRPRLSDRARCTRPYASQCVTTSAPSSYVIAGTTRHLAFNISGSWRSAVVGFLGSYTTVSSFSLQT